MRDAGLAARFGPYGGRYVPETVAEAVGRLRPAMVDVSSGVESAPGRKDVALVRAFVEAVAAAGTVTA